MGGVRNFWREPGRRKVPLAKTWIRAPAAIFAKPCPAAVCDRTCSLNALRTSFAIALLAALLLPFISRAQAVTRNIHPAPAGFQLATGSTPMTLPSKIKRPKRYKPFSSQTATAQIMSDGDLHITWHGRIRTGMAYYLRKTYDELGRKAKHVYFKINSGGGSVAEGERVIEVLRLIRRSSGLTTVVGRGGTCASMCVPVYLQGARRIGARTSVWMFHEVSRKTRRGKLIFYRNESRRLFRQYYEEAGVSRRWLRRMLEEMRNADVWRTGQGLIDAKTGIITAPLSNRRVRR